MEPDTTSTAVSNPTTITLPGTTLPAPIGRFYLASPDPPVREPNRECRWCGLEIARVGSTRYEDAEEHWIHLYNLKPDCPRHFTAEPK